MSDLKINLEKEYELLYSSKTKRYIESSNWKRAVFVLDENDITGNSITNALKAFCKDDFIVLKLIGFGQAPNRKYRVIIKFKDINDAMMTKLKGIKKILQDFS